MAKRTPKKIIQVPIDDELLMRIDGTVGRVAESRTAFIRDACRWRLKCWRDIDSIGSMWKAIAKNQRAPPGQGQPHAFFRESCRGRSGR